MQLLRTCNAATMLHALKCNADTTECQESEDKKYFERKEEKQSETKKKNRILRKNLHTNTNFYRNNIYDCSI